MNRLPDGWCSARLGDLGDWTSGGTPSRGRSDYYGEGIPWVKTGDLCDGPLLEVPESITELGLANSSAKRLPPGTLLVAMYGATIGKLGLLTFEAATNQACAALLPVGRTGDFIPYIFQYLLSQRDELRRIGQGGAQPNISQAILKDYRIPLPPVNEQRRIVAKLEALQSRSRRAREALDAVPPLLEKLRQSTLAAAFRGDLTKDWRAQNPNPEPAEALLARIRTERRRKWEESELAKLKAKGKPPTNDSWKAKYKEPEPVDTTNLPELPEGWCWATIDTVGDVLLGRRRADAEYVAGLEGRVLRPYVRVANVRENYLDLSHVLQMPFSPAELEVYRLQPGDIVVSEGQSAELIGRSATYEGGWEDLCIQATVHRFRAFPSATTSAFAQLVFLHHLHAGVFRAASALTTNIAHLTSERLKPIRFPIPPLAEQAIVVQRVTGVLAAVSRLSDTWAEAVHEESHLQRAVLAKAFRGELVPQNPNDEPADVMLARLKAEAPAESSSQRARRAKAAE